MKCANCGEGHLANYGGCSVSKEAKKMESLMMEENIPYLEAKARTQSKAAAGNEGISTFRPLQIDLENSNTSPANRPSNENRTFAEVVGPANQSRPGLNHQNGGITTATDGGIGNGVSGLIQDFVSCCNLFITWQKTPKISD